MRAKSGAISRVGLALVAAVTLALGTQAPGLAAPDKAQLARLRRAHAAYLRQQGRAGQPPKLRGLPRVDLATARAIAPPKSALVRTLAADNSPTLERVFAEIVAFQHQVAVGNARTIEPKHRARAPARVATILERVYARPGVGVRTLELAEIKAQLPAVLAALATQRDPHKAWTSEYRLMVEELVHGFIKDYREQVLDGPAARHALVKQSGLRWATFQAMQQNLGAYVPAKRDVAPSAARVELAAGLFGELRAKRIATSAFIKQTGIPVELIRVLQQIDPRFANPEGTASARTILPDVRGVRQPRGRQGPNKPLLLTLENAERVGARAKKIYQRDVLVRSSEIVTALNADKNLLRTLGDALPDGKLTKKRYDVLRSLATDAGKRDAFPDLNDGKAKNAVLAREYKALRAKHPQLGKAELVLRMQKRYPRFSQSRLGQLTRAGLVEPFQPQYGGDQRRTREQRREDAAELARVLPLTKRGTIPEAAVLMKARGRERKQSYLFRIRRQFEAELFPAERKHGAHAQVQRMRSSGVIAERLALIVALAPPGLRKPALARLLDRILVDEGLQPYASGDVSANVDRYINAHYGSLREQYARTVSEIVAEYARVADPRASEAQIIDAMLEDYPSIRRRQLTYWRTFWTKDPQRYPALQRKEFRVDGKLELKGLGERLPKKRQRYVGGWDVERALLRPAQQDSLLARALARRSQYLRIPTRLPLLDEMIADLKGARPLETHHVLWITHLQGTMVPLADALRQAGASAKDMVIVGTPYGSGTGPEGFDPVRTRPDDTPAVINALRAEGFKNIHVPRLARGAMTKEVERAVDEMVGRVRRTGKAVVVMDDGGYVAQVLREKYAGAEYADVVRKFKIVEQTTRGITKSQAGALLAPVINAAGARTKVLGESTFIGRAVAAKLLQGMERIGRPTAALEVVQHGFGPIGKATAMAMAAKGHRVTVVESSEAAYQRAASVRGPDGKPLFKVVRLADTRGRNAALRRAEMVVGCSGNASMSLADFRLLKAGVVVASTSSADIEIARNHVVDRATSRRVLDPGNPLVRLPTAAYKLFGKEVVLLGDGWPVNFDGDVEDIPAQQIQLTRGLMLAGAIQAAGLNGNDVRNRRIIEFDRKADAKLLWRYRQIERQTRDLPIGDPAAWSNHLRRFAGKLL